MKKILLMIKFLLVVTYSLIIVPHVFFPSSGLNIALSSKLFFAQFYSFPILFGGSLVIGALVIFGICLLINQIILKKRKIGLFWLAIGLLSLVFMLGGSEPTKTTSLEETKTIKIVEWNTLNNLNKAHIEKIFKDYDADIAVFPELKNQSLEAGFREVGLDFDRYEVFLSPKTGGGIAPVTVITKKDFSGYRMVKEDNMTSFGTVVLQAKDKAKPAIVGLHTAPPLPALMNDWKRDLVLIAHHLSKQYRDAIIIGDFNATMRHGAMNALGTYEDALSYLPKFGRGTWHTRLPSYFRTTIDHVLVPKDSYVVQAIQMVDFKVSDHACVFVSLAKK